MLKGFLAFIVLVIIVIPITIVVNIRLGTGTLCARLSSSTSHLILQYRIYVSSVEAMPFYLSRSLAEHILFFDSSKWTLAQFAFEI